jgi:histone deacetylase complex regulatory component SIN3
MFTKSTLKEGNKSEIEERSEEDLLEEEIRNQQTLDSFVESNKNWS